MPTAMMRIVGLVVHWSASISLQFRVQDLKVLIFSNLSDFNDSFLVPGSISTSSRSSVVAVTPNRTFCMEMADLVLHLIWLLSVQRTNSGYLSLLVNIKCQGSLCHILLISHGSVVKAFILIPFPSQMCSVVRIHQSVSS